MKTDERLYTDLGSGQARAFAALYARYEKPLFGFVLGFVKNREDAEEIFHDAFHALIRAARTGDKTPEQVGSWLFTVARNLSLNRLRARRPVQALENTFAVVASESGAESRLVEQGRAEALATAVDKLPPQLGAVYRLRAGGASYEEMAKNLDVPLGTVKSRVNALVRKLKKDMSPWIAK